VFRNVAKAINSLKLLIAKLDDVEDPAPVMPDLSNQKLLVDEVAAPPGVFEDELILDIAGHDSIIAGSLELIGLDDVRNIVGDAWPSIAAKVNEIVLDELQRCLDPSDIFRRHGEASFLIQFDGLDKTAAENKAQRTALRIRAALIGRVPEIADAISIKHFVVDVDPSTLKDDGPSIADTLFERLVDMRKSADTSLQPDRRPLIKDVQVQFSPVWHVQKQVTILNRCLLNSIYGGTALSQFQSLVDTEEMAASYAELDYLTLTQSLEALHRVVQAGRTAMMLVPVDFSTILNQASVVEYVRLLQAMPDGYRKYVTIEIGAVSISHPASSLLQIAGLLGRYVKYVAIELLLNDPRIGAVVSGKPWAISLNLSALTSANPRLPFQLKQFTSAANAAAVNTMARGVNTIGLALAATDAGFTYVDGSAIHLPFREPRPPQKHRPLPQMSKTGNTWGQPR
jgi:hypothetical protein